MIYVNTQQSNKIVGLEYYPAVNTIFEFHCCLFIIS